MKQNLQDRNGLTQKTDIVARRMGEGSTRSLGLTDATSRYRMDKQQGPTVEHSELYSIFCDKPQWKRM